MTALRLIALAMILFVGDIVAVHGQTPSPLPPGMTQDQFNAMVDAIGKALVVKLKNEGIVPAPAAAPSQPGVASNVVADELAAFLEKTERVLPAVPILGTYLASIPGLLEAGGVDEAPLDFCSCWHSWLAFPLQRKRSCANRSVISGIGWRQAPYPSEGSRH